MVKAFMVGVGGLEIIFILIFVLLPVILWIWALVDLLKRNFADSATKLIWALVIIFLPLLGSILYLAIGRNQGTR